MTTPRTSARLCATGAGADGAARPRPGFRFEAAALALVAVVHAARLAMLAPTVFWSPDEGAKFIQMHSRRASADQPLRLGYGAVNADPFLVFYPAASVFPRPTRLSDVRFNWPAAFPFVSRPFFRFFGPWGLYLIPLACGCLTAALAGRLAARIEPCAGPPAVAIAGLASPLGLYSLLFMEHTAACALGLGAMLFATAAPRARPAERFLPALGAAACLAGFFALRDEAAIVIAAFVVAAWAAWRNRIPKWAVWTALALMAMALAAVRPVAAAWGETGRTAELLGDAARAVAGLADPDLWRGLPRHIRLVALNNPDAFGVPLPAAWEYAGLGGLALCAAAGLVPARLRPACRLAGALLLGAAAGRGLCEPDRYRAVHSLFLPMPALALAWLPLRGANAARGRAERFMAVFLPLFLALFVVATWLLRRPAGGPEWGLRYALLAYPLGAAVIAVVLTRGVREPGRLRRAILVVTAAVLLAISCGYGVRGVAELQVTKRDLAAFEKEIRDTGDPVVTDRWWLAAALAPTFVRAELFTLNPGTDLATWLERVGMRRTAFLHASYEEPPDILRAADGTTAVLLRRRRIQDMIFSRYAIRGPP